MTKAKPLPDTSHIADDAVLYDPDWWTRKALRLRGFKCKNRHYYHPDHYEPGTHMLYKK